MENKFLQIGEPVMDVNFDMYLAEKFTKAKLSDYKGKWLVVFFYPADFTFVCPTELKELADNYAIFKELNTEILAVSTDTVFVHKAWHDYSPAIKSIQYPMVADPTGLITRQFGVYIEAEGLARRGTFIIDPDGVLQACEIQANNIGRSASELIRKIQAAQFVRANNGEACPASWKPGQKTLTPGIDLVGKI